MTILLEDRRSAMADLAPKRITPVKWWAAGGAIILSLMTFSFSRWFLGGHAHPVSTGAAEAPTFMVVVARMLEIGFSSWGLICIYLYIIRPWRRERRLTADGVMLISLGSVWFFADPIANYFRITYLYNSVFVNLGCPQCYLPGFQARMEGYVEPALFAGTWYIGMFVTVTLIGCRIVAWYRRRWPHHGRIAAVTFFLPLVAIFDFFCEALFLWVGAYIYPNMPFAIWGDRYYRVPLVGILGTGLFYTAAVCCRYFTNDKGETWAERGLSQMKVVSPKQRGVLRIVASIGMYNAALLLVYWIPFGFVSAINKDSWPADVYRRPYFVTDVCGPGTEYACLDKRVPIPPAPSSAHISPEGKLIAPNGLPNQTTGK